MKRGLRLKYPLFEQNRAPQQGMRADVQWTFKREKG
jgi:hypothetical protein